MWKFIFETVPNFYLIVKREKPLLINDDFRERLSEWLSKIVSVLYFLQFWQRFCLKEYHGPWFIEKNPIKDLPLEWKKLQRWIFLLILKVLCKYFSTFKGYMSLRIRGQKVFVIAICYINYDMYFYRSPFVCINFPKSNLITSLDLEILN